jgi:hypothetical protein
MVNLQEQLSPAVNAWIMSGIVVSEEEWTMFRRLASKLGSTFTFNDDVHFVGRK